MDAIGIKVGYTHGYHHFNKWNMHLKINFVMQKSTLLLYDKCNELMIANV